MTNDEFADSTVLLHTRVTSVVSEHPEQLYRVFDKHTATLGLSSETVFSLPGAHATLIAGDEGESSHKVLRNTLEFSIFREYELDVWPVSESLPGLRLLNSSSIVQPPFRSNEQQSPTSVLQLSDFTEWIQQQEEFHRTRWILISKDHSVPFNSFDSLLQKWREDTIWPKAVMSTCDLSNYRRPHHNREDNDCITRAVLSTQLSRVIAYLLPRTEPIKRPKRILNRLKDPRALMDSRSLLDLFEDVNLWLRDSDIQAIWCIWNFHKCPHSQQALLLHRLTKCFEFSEYKPPILLIGQDDSEKKLAHIMEEANVPRFEHVSTYQELGDPSYTLEVEELQTFLQGRIEIRRLFEKAVQITNSPSFINILASWIYDVLGNGLASKATERRIALLLEEVCTRPSSLIQVVIESLPEDQKVRALQILRWVTYSLQPLSPYQLAEALLTTDMDCTRKQEISPEVEPNYEIGHLHFIYGIILELPRRLHYMIKIEHNEVRLSHPMISEFLSSHEYEAPVDPAESNLQIFKCLLSHISAQAGSFPLLSSRVSSLSRPYDLAWYAINYWPQHYRIAREHQSTAHRADECLKEFLECQGHAVKYWIRASSEVNSPTITSADDTSLEILKVLLRSNLYKMDGVEDIFKCWPWDPNVAILELVRCGDLDIMRTLSFDSLNQLQVQQILKQSTEANTTVETMEYLFQQAKDRAPIPFPFLIRLVQLGAKNSVKIACETQKLSMDQRGDLLLNAVKSRQKEMIEMLWGLETASSDHHVLRAAEEACHVGDPTQLQPLLKLISLEQRHTTLLRYASVRGNYLAVRVLLQEFDANNSKHMAQLQESSALTTSATKGFTNCTSAILEYYNANNNQQELCEAITAVLDIARPPQETCQLLFKTGVSFSEEHISQLFQAAIEKGRLDLVALIFDHCGGINIMNSVGTTPLHMAAAGNYPRIAEYLLERGADINARDYNGCTPIYKACVENHPQVVSLLLTRGADVTIASNRNWSPLEASYDLPDVMKMIVTKASPPPDYKRITTGTVDYTALWLAVRDNQIESVRLLLDHGDPDLEFAPIGEFTVIKAGITALIYATSRGFDEILRLLLERGANINHHVASLNGNYASHFARRETTMAVLIEYNIDLESTDADGRSPLNAFAGWRLEQQVPIIHRLVNAGANLESEDKYSNTPLSTAAICKNTTAVKYLVSKGAQINTLRPRHGGPVHRAARLGETKMVKMLVGMGGDPQREHYMVGSPVQDACAGLQDRETAEYLVGELGVELNTAGGVTATVFGQACRTGSLGVVRYLVDNGASTAAVGRNGVPSVFNLCLRQANGVEVLEELLSRGTPIWTVRDCLGRNILHAAVMGGSKELVEKLLEGEPNLLQERDKDGWTALHWAARTTRTFDEGDNWAWSSWDVRQEIVELLLEKECPGVDERVVVGEKRWTPRDIARHHMESQSVLEAFSITDSDEVVSTEQEYGDEWSCDCCFAQMKGVLHRCKAEPCYKDFGLCFKCIAYRELCHDPEHEFEEVGRDFEE
ncbi:ankyrin repeat-containing domain protein [Xylaria palmicola]|nr:ankyrin repeat-containing domain protein [Xylaria palmicola]